MYFTALPPTGIADCQLAIADFDNYASPQDRRGVVNG
jgi:hypothetical protein